ncbi:MAG TPA: SpoIIE family protein phosphatase [Rubrobacteraceae bacterium]|nr:SpoIIE family protein phosphatase [Rubrobacteraceae bacterium]
MREGGLVGSPPLLQWGIAARPYPGQIVSGDLHVVRPFPEGVLVVVMDGLGHGISAATAARTASAALEGHAHESPISLIERCHQESKQTRGVVMSIASFNAPNSTMTWLGVGNVDGMLVRSGANAKERATGQRDEALITRGGVVGYQIPRLREAEISVNPDDVLILTTDGIRPVTIDHLTLSDPPQQIADRILELHAKNTDDALVLVARYLGGAQ